MELKNPRVICLLTVLILIIPSGCIPAVLPTATSTALPATGPPPPLPSPLLPSPQPSFTPLPLTATPSPEPTIAPSPISPRLVPAFEHIAIFVLENKEFDTVMGDPRMPNYNRWAQQYTLLTQHYAIRHPSLPNYIAMMAGSTLGIETNYPTRAVDAPSLPDLLEASGKTWKAYMDSMPEPCYLQDTLRYVQKHNPFVWFTSIRDNPDRCKKHIVPMPELATDLANGTLPDFMFIVPDLCNGAHDSYSNPDQCQVNVADDWLGMWVNGLLADPSVAQNGLIILTWDEGQGDHTCCGLPTGGGRIATILISALAKPGFQDATPYTLYSLTKTIAAAWDLPELGHAADPQTTLITAPWK